MKIFEPQFQNLDSEHHLGLNCLFEYFIAKLHPLMRAEAARSCFITPSLCGVVSL